MSPVPDDFSPSPRVRMALKLTGLSDSQLHEFACRCVEHCLRSSRGLPPFEHEHTVQGWVDRKRAWMGGALSAEELVLPVIADADPTNVLLAGLVETNAMDCARLVAAAAASLYGQRWHAVSGGGRHGAEEACAAERDEAICQRRTITALRKTQTETSGTGGGALATPNQR